MTPDEQNAAMAELEEWINIVLWSGQPWGQPPGKDTPSRFVDDYRLDLNAVARVRAKLSRKPGKRATGAIVSDYDLYLAELWDLVSSRIHASTTTVEDHSELEVADATAAEHTEAILRATGKWKEGV